MKNMQCLLCFCLIMLCFTPLLSMQEDEKNNIQTKTTELHERKSLFLMWRSFKSSLKQEPFLYDEKILNQLKVNAQTNTRDYNTHIITKCAYEVVKYRNETPDIFAHLVPYLFNKKGMNEKYKGKSCIYGNAYDYPLYCIAFDTAAFNRAIYELNGSLRQEANYYGGYVESGSDIPVIHGNPVRAGFGGYVPLIYALAGRFERDYVRVIKPPKNVALKKQPTYTGPIRQELRINGKNYVVNHYKEDYHFKIANEWLFDEKQEQLKPEIAKMIKNNELENYSKFLHPEDKKSYWEYSLKPTLYPGNISYDDAVNFKKSCISLLLCLKRNKYKIPKMVNLHHILPAMSSQIRDTFKNQCTSIFEDMNYAINKMKEENLIENVDEAQRAFFENFEEWYKAKLAAYLLTINNFDLVKTIIKRANQEN